MKGIVTTVIGMAAAGLIGVAANASEERREGSGGPLIVHEWGTFTNFAGSDGVQRKFATGIGLSGDLPEFVHSFAEGGGSGEQVKVHGHKFDLLCTQRMETPVIYIYPGCRGPVDVEARLLDGEMTEFYPPLNGIGGGAGGTGAAGKTDRSIVRWTGINYSADPKENADKLPRQEHGSHYFAARATDSCVLTVDALGARHHEKFLFYRGAANFQSRVTLRALGQDRFEVTNTTGEPIAAGFMVRIDGEKVRWNPVKAIGAKGAVSLTTERGTIDGLAKAMRHALATAGLYEKEAAAMVETWKHQWFKEHGTRLLYIMPGAEVNRVVPLKITPEPDELKRVFVGRSEVLTPEDENTLIKAFARMKEAPEAERAELRSSLNRWGRFYEPVEQRVNDLRAGKPTTPTSPGEPIATGMGK